MKTSGVSKSHDLSQFHEGDLTPEILIPVGRNSDIPKEAALSAELKGLRPLNRTPSKEGLNNSQHLKISA
ncbi:hypothetical protein [Xanthomonas fragariae]|uniref:hypothetical protein n=1 Tax=Xanthomonas fragariae TaxID=48664 RepID=UPI003530CBB8